MDKQTKAEDVKQLLENTLLQEILDAVKLDALHKLAKVKASDTEAIQEEQATVRVVEKFHDKAREIIAQGAQNKRLQ